MKPKISRGPDGSQTLFTDLPAACFPVTMTAFVDGEVIWERVIEPMVATGIPGATAEQAGRVSVRCRYADGTEAWAHPRDM